MADVHPTAIVEDGARIGEGTIVGPYSVIRKNVSIGENCWIGPHVVIEGVTQIGSGTRIFQFASVGSAPQDLKYDGEPSRTIIGKNNTIREYVTVQTGTAGGGMETVVGEGNLFMVSSHVGHDVKVGNHCVIANCVAIGGHVEIGDRVILGGLSAVHQFVKVGELAILGGGSMITGDIVPYVMGQGDRARVVGLNKIGLQRAGVSEEEVAILSKTFKSLYLGKGLAKERITAAREIATASVRASKMVSAFESPSDRGVASFGRKGSKE